MDGGPSGSGGPSSTPPPEPVALAAPRKWRQGLLAAAPSAAPVDSVAPANPRPVDSLDNRWGAREERVSVHLLGRLRWADVPIEELDDESSDSSTL